VGVRQGILYNHTGAPGIPAVVGQALPVKKAPGPNLATRFSAPQKLAGCGRLRMANSKWQLHCHNGDARLVGFQRSTQAETHPKYFRLHYVPRLLPIPGELLAGVHRTLNYPLDGEKSPPERVGSVGFVIPQIIRSESHQNRTPPGLAD